MALELPEPLESVVPELLEEEALLAVPAGAESLEGFAPLALSFLPSDFLSDVLSDLFSVLLSEPFPGADLLPDFA